MKIEEIKERFNYFECEITDKVMFDLLKNDILSKIEQLEADKLEMAKAIVNHQNKSPVYCCNGRSNSNNHSDGCIIGQLEQYIKEVEK